MLLSAENKLSAGSKDNRPGSVKIIGWSSNRTGTSIDDGAKIKQLA